MPLDSADVSNKQRAVEITKLARAAMAQGDWVTAEQIARQAESLAPDTAFSATEDRPTLVLLDIERVKRGGSGLAAHGSPAPSVIPASAVEATHRRILIRTVSVATATCKHYTIRPAMQRVICRPIRPATRPFAIGQNDAAVDSSGDHEFYAAADRQHGTDAGKRHWRRVALVSGRGRGSRKVAQWMKLCKRFVARMPSKPNSIRQPGNSCTNI